MSNYLETLRSWSHLALRHVLWAFKAHPIVTSAGLAVATLAGLKWLTSTRWSKSTSRIAGTSILITGANAGIGWETAVQCAEAGALNIVILCRTAKTAAEAEKAIKKAARHPRFQVQTVSCDLGSLESVRQCVQVLAGMDLKYDHLMLNAGVMMAEQGKTVDGFETHIGVNHFGHFLLTNLVLQHNLLKEHARVVAVSSNATSLWPRGFDINDLDWKTRTYSVTNAYAASKTANVLMMQELQRRFDAEGKGRLAFSVHPGFVRTKITREAAGIAKLFLYLLYPLYWSLSLSPLQGVQCTLHAATSPDITKIGGTYFNNLRPSWTISSKHPELAAQLWKISEERTGLLSHPK